MIQFEAPKNLNYSGYELEKTNLGQPIIYSYLDTVAETFGLETENGDYDGQSIEYRKSLINSIYSYYNYNVRNLVRYILITFVSDYFPEVNIGTNDNIITKFDKVNNINNYIDNKLNLMQKISNFNNNDYNVFYYSTQTLSNIYNYFNDFAHFLVSNYMSLNSVDPQIIPIYKKLAPITDIDISILIPIQDQYLKSVQIIIEMFGLYYSFILESIFNIYKVIIEMWNFPDKTIESKSREEIVDITNSITNYISNSINSNNEN